MARVPLIDEDTLEDEEIADSAATPAMPKGPHVRVGARKSSSTRKRGTTTRKRSGGGSRASGARPGASPSPGRKPRAAADPLTEWAGEALAAGLQFLSLRLTRGAGMQRAEALGVAKPVMRLLRRNVLPATIIDIDMPDEDKRDISLLLVTLGRYLGRLLDRRNRPSPAQMAEYARRAYQAQAMRAQSSPDLGGLTPDEWPELEQSGAFDMPEAGGPAHNGAGDGADEALLSEMLARSQAAQAASAGGGSDSVTVIGGGPPGVVADGFAHMIAAGVLPGYSGEVDNG